MRTARVWAGMVVLWLLAYGLIIDTAVRKGWIATWFGGFLTLALTATVITLGVRLIRRQRRETLPRR